MVEILEALGLKVSVVLAGFIGGIVSLSMIQGLRPMQAAGVAVGGTACAAYLTPLTVEFTGLSGSSEHALAFFLGVCGMNLVAGAFKVSERFRAAPEKTIAQLKSGEIPDD